jgi:raffinose/stachyose/melibiose transport system permease protein
MEIKRKRADWSLTVFFTILSVIYILPIVIIIINSLKEKGSIALDPFSLPSSESWVGLQNYISGVKEIKFFNYFGTSLFITIGSVLVILLCTSMCAWYITRIKRRWTKMVYYLCVFSMVVPFQMVMFTLSKTADFLGLNTPWGIIVVYLGFGAGLAVFMFSGFVKGIPIEIEEAAMIDGCNPIQTYFLIVIPILKPTYISVGILETMWIWNDYLLPYLVLDLKRYKTIPIVIQYLRGGYGRVDMGAIMACLVLAIIPIIVFYLAAQKYIIKGVVEGAVKG